MAEKTEFPYPVVDLDPGLPGQTLPAGGAGRYLSAKCGLPLGTKYQATARFAAVDSRFAAQGRIGSKLHAGKDLSSDCNSLSGSLLYQQ